MCLYFVLLDCLFRTFLHQVIGMYRIHRTSMLPIFLLFVHTIDHWFLLLSFPIPFTFGCCFENIVSIIIFIIKSGGTSSKNSKNANIFVYTELIDTEKYYPPTNSLVRNKRASTVYNSQILLTYVFTHPHLIRDNVVYNRMFLCTHTLESNQTIRILVSVISLKNCSSSILYALGASYSWIDAVWFLSHPGGEKNNGFILIFVFLCISSFLSFSSVVFSRLFFSVPLFSKLKIKIDFPMLLVF